MGEIIDLIIRNARALGADDLIDIAIKGEKIVMVDKKISAACREEIDAGGRFVSPGFVDSHMHLDKAFLGGDAKWTSRTVADAVKITRKGKEESTPEEIKSRARKAAEMALMNGTTALRTHVDVDQSVGLKSLKAMLELKRECSDWIDIQVVAFMTEFPFTSSRTGESLLRRAVKLGAEVVGGVPYRDPNPEKYYDIIFEVAKEFNAAIDLHVDETNDPNVLTLDIFAEKAVEHGYEEKVAASHCCSLSAIGEDKAKEIIKKVARAKMSVIANPFTNLYLWGEDGRPEGLTRVKELLEGGVNVAYGTDNTQDAFNPLGNADMLLAGLFLAYQKRLDGKEALAKIFDMGTVNAAKATGLVANYGIRKGGRADLVVFDAQSAQEAIIMQARRLYVIKRGKVVVRNGLLTL